jgi:hypothetical protein
VSRFIVDDDRITCDHAPGNRNADTRLLSAAFHASDGSNDPAAGSAGVKRAIASRTQWEPATAFLVEHGPSTWKGLQNAVPSMRAYTSRAACSAIDKGEWLGVEYSEGAPRIFKIKGAA